MWLASGAWRGLELRLRNTRRRHGGNKKIRHYCLSAAVSPSPPALSLLTPLWLVLSLRGLALVPVTPALGVSRVGDAGAALSGVVCAAMRPPGCPTIDSFASPATPRHSHTHTHMRRCRSRRRCCQRASNLTFGTLREQLVFTSWFLDRATTHSRRATPFTSTPASATATALAAGTCGGFQCPVDARVATGKRDLCRGTIRGHSIAVRAGS